MPIEDERHEKSGDMDLPRFIAPATVLTIGAVAVTVFACELRGIETRLTDMNSEIANLDAKIDRRGEAVEQHLSK